MKVRTKDGYRVDFIVTRDKKTRSCHIIVEQYATLDVVAGLCPVLGDLQAVHGVHLGTSHKMGIEGWSTGYAFNSRILNKLLREILTRRFGASRRETDEKIAELRTSLDTQTCNRGEERTLVLETQRFLMDQPSVDPSPN